jgi:hypothetical protein
VPPNHHWLVLNVKPRENADELSWVELNSSNFFAPHFSKTAVAIVAKNPEQTVIFSIRELEDLIEDYIASVMDQFQTAPSSTPVQLILQVAQIDPTSWQLRVVSHDFNYFFDPLEIWFDHADAVTDRMERERQHWLTQLEGQALIHWIKGRALEWFDSQIAQLEIQKADFKALTAEAEKWFVNQDQVSSLYLMQAWSVPLFVTIDKPELAAMLRARLIAAFLALRTEIYEVARSRFSAQLLRLILSAPLTTKELAVIFKKVKISEDGNPEKLLIHLDNLYQFILEKSGVPIEVSQLMGVEVFIKHLLYQLENFPDTSSSSDMLSQVQKGSLLEVYLRYSFQYLIQHNVTSIGQPGELVFILIKTLINRLKYFMKTTESTL